MDALSALAEAGASIKETMALAVAAVLKEAHMPEIIIRHPKTSQEYGIQSADFKRGKHYQTAKGEFVTFEAAGFEIVSLADGQPYEAPEPRQPQGEHAP